MLGPRQLCLSLCATMFSQDKTIHVVQTTYIVELDQLHHQETPNRKESKLNARQPLSNRIIDSAHPD